MEANIAHAGRSRGVCHLTSGNFINTKVPKPLQRKPSQLGYAMGLAAAATMRETNDWAPCFEIRRVEINPVSWDGETLLSLGVTETKMMVILYS